MDKVFVDTVAWIALLNADDALHTPAQQVMEELRQARAQLITTEFVLLKVADALSAPCWCFYGRDITCLLFPSAFHPSLPAWVVHPLHSARSGSAPR